MVKKKNNGRKTTTDNSGSNSFALFGDNITSIGNNNNVDLFSKNIKETKKADSTKQIGSSYTDEKPKSPELCTQEIRHKAKRGFRSLKVNQNNINSESASVNDKGQNCSKDDGGNKQTGTKSGKLKKDDNGSVTKTIRNKRKVQKNEGGDGVCENDNPDSKVVDYNEYPVGEFEVTDKIRHYSLQAAPRKIDDFLSEILIDGKRYTVSSGSIKNGQYIQGLDGHFLVSKYRVGKKHI